ncbi:DUF3152 domain-containing protein [Streptomyces niveus]|uniref:DUF3152 domain-containing protein n=1 Tax=Streptomyces niveus TaxID=193462 RepID=UPI00363A26E1
MRHANNRRAGRASHPARLSRRAALRKRAAARRRRLLGVAALVVLAGLTLAVLGAVRWQGGGSSSSAAGQGVVEPGAGGQGAVGRGGGSSPSPKASPPPSPSMSPSPKASTHRVVKSGTGEFSTAAAHGGPVGTGTIRRYSVQVEGGTGIPAADAAKEIAGILGDRRGWTANGRDGFQLVSSGPRDFEVKIATPDTVDRICGAAGLHTRGEVNCNVGDQVIVNLKRWLTGSPQFPGPLHEYRALIINHEVGHRIGHGHEGCPGPGRPAPAMMQQIDGLHGCEANAWPYDEKGVYLQGPGVP